MKTSFLVLDTEFNRQWVPELIGLRFAVAPSYTAVMECKVKPDYFNYEEYQKWSNFSTADCS